MLTQCIPPPLATLPTSSLMLFLGIALLVEGKGSCCNWRHHCHSPHPLRKAARWARRGSMCQSRVHCLSLSSGATSFLHAALFQIYKTLSTCFFQTGWCGGGNARGESKGEGKALTPPHLPHLVAFLISWVGKEEEEEETTVAQFFLWRVAFASYSSLAQTRPISRRG